MQKRAIQFGKLGSILGALAGFIELSVGTKILPWIGNKESPFVLGLVTMILSGVAFLAMFSAGKKALPTNNRKLAVFLGVLLPAVVCFTTVGRLWYLPGSLLLIASFLLAFVYWIRQSTESSSMYVTKKLRANQIFGVMGSLLVLASVGLAFFMAPFGLYQSEIDIEANRVQFQVVPMDILRLDHMSTNGSLEEHEVSLVMCVYILLVLGASIALISSLADSKIFKLIGGGVVLMGLILFLVEIPGILEQMGAPTLKLFDLFYSLGWGWYISMAGVFLIILADMFKNNRQEKPYVWVI